MKTRLLALLLCLAFCVETLDSKFVDQSSRKLGNSKTKKVSEHESDDGSGSDSYGFGSGDGDGDYPVLEPDFGSADEMTACQRLFSERQHDGKGIVGSYVPQCAADGSFVPVQCHGSTGQCWCVDEYGKQLAGTIRFGFHKPDCTDKKEESAWSRPPTFARPLQPVVTHNPMTDDGILIDHKTGPSFPDDRNVDIVRNGDDEDDDGEYPDNGVVALTSRGLLNHPGILAAMIAGAVLVLLCVILLIMFVVYRMRKKDEGSYALDEPKKKLTSEKDCHNSSIVYTKAAPSDREFYA